MSDGVIYKGNGKTWSIPKVMDTGITKSTFDEGKIMHGSPNDVDWFENYPLTQVYSSYFNVSWTQGYNGSGVKLDSATYGDHPRSGDTANFYGVWGFNKTEMKNFVGNGTIQELKIYVMFDDPTHAGNPVVNFFPNTYSSKPTSYSGTYDNTNYNTQHTFVQTGSNFATWISLPVGAWLDGTMGGITCHAPSATTENSCRFAGKTTSNGLNGYNTLLWIKVLK